jgi:ADP-L-glycero-D-manno-heptose 6-epimerase
VYGAGRKFSEERANEAPLNVYAYSKFLFDEVVRRRLPGRTSQILGLRYFNVYGPERSAQRAGMASVALHAYRQFAAEGRVRLFVGSDGFADGEQRRDFVHVDDVANVNLHFLEHPEVSGVYNCGTGRAQSFNEVATAVINTVRDAQGEQRLATAELVSRGLIEYIPFPPQLEGKYQSFTEADLAQLRATGIPANS